MQQTPTEVRVPGVVPWASTADSCAAGRRPTSSIRRHGGCRGFAGPYPSTPLDELYEVVLTTLTDGDKALTDGTDRLPGIATLATAVTVRCPNLTFHERRTSWPGTDRIQPGAGVLQPRRRREADQPARRGRGGDGAVGARGPCRGAMGVRGTERRRPGRRACRSRRATGRAARRRRRGGGRARVRGADA